MRQAKKPNRKQKRLQRSAADHPASASSRPSRPAPSQWHAAPEARRERLQSLDTHAHLRNALRSIAAERGEWAGLPMPLEDERLVVEPSYPYAQGLMSMCGGKEEAPDAATQGWRVRNSFYSAHKRCVILVIEKADGRITYGVEPAVHSLPLALRTLGCSAAWGIEQESTALELLGTLLSHHQFKTYLLTGMFLERSKRSGVFYLFRRLRPTVAIREDKGTTKIMCALCQHPIAHYTGSWAGAMCPSDDVLAHLSLMRGDEAMFWRRANQHPAWLPQAGL